MRVLLSIKPEYVDKIFAGIKKYEYRKTKFKRSNIDTVLVYSSSPVCRVVGEFEIKGVIYDDVKTVWKQTQQYSGVTEEFYFTYYKGRKEATAIQIGKITQYKEAYLLSDYNVTQAPQSFCYIDD